MGWLGVVWGPGNEEKGVAAVSVRIWHKGVVLGYGQYC